MQTLISVWYSLKGHVVTTHYTVSQKFQGAQPGITTQWLQWAGVGLVQLCCCWGAHPCAMFSASTINLVQGLLQAYVPYRSLRSDDPLFLVVLRSRLVQVIRFLVVIPQLWNKLHGDFKYYIFTHWLLIQHESKFFIHLKDWTLCLIIFLMVLSFVSVHCLCLYIMYDWCCPSAYKSACLEKVWRPGGLQNCLASAGQYEV